MLNASTSAGPGGVDAPPGRTWANVMVREYLREVLYLLRDADIRRIDVTGAYVKVVISRGVLAAEWSATMDDPAVRARAGKDVAAAIERLKEEAPLP